MERFVEGPSPLKKDADSRNHVFLNSRPKLDAKLRNLKLAVKIRGEFKKKKTQILVIIVGPPILCFISLSLLYWRPTSVASSSFKTSRAPEVFEGSQFFI